VTEQPRLLIAATASCCYETVQALVTTSLQQCPSPTGFVNGNHITR